MGQEMDLDRYGRPITPEGATHHDGAPPRACAMCHEHHPVTGQDPWEWCQEMRTCAETIDWDLIYERRH